VALLLSVAGILGVKKKQPLSLEVAKSALPIADAPACSGKSLRASAGQSAPLSPGAHSVTLTWNAVAPRSTSPRDAIEGYYVYRSLTSRAFPESTRISEAPLRGTRCLDTNVEPRKTYFYTVKAVTQAGKLSGASVEVQTVVPFP
jgi:hypothetical protein